MKKLLSIILSVMLLLGTLSVLTLLPVTATDTATGPKNLIINGDGEGVDGVTAYAETDSTVCPGYQVANEAYGWHSSGDSATGIYADCKVQTPSTYSWVPTYYSGYSGTSWLEINNWRQALQDVKIEAGKTYMVSALVAGRKIKKTDGTVPSGSCQMFIDTGVNSVATTKAPSDKSWYTEYTYEYEVLYTDTDESIHYGFNFTPISFVFDSNDFIEANNMEDTDGDGKYDVRFVLHHTTGDRLFFDDVSFYEVVTASSEEGGIVKGDTEAFLGESVSLEAVPYYGNGFKGWYAKGVDYKTATPISTDLVYNGPAQDMVAVFNIYNQIVDGNLEIGGSYLIDALKSETQYNKDNGPTERSYEVVADPVQNTDLHGNSVLHVSPTANLNFPSRNLIPITVTVEKDQDYLFSFSFYENTEQPYHIYLGIYDDSTSWVYNRDGTDFSSGVHAFWTEEGAKQTTSPWRYKLYADDIDTSSGYYNFSNGIAKSKTWYTSYVYFNSGNAEALFDEGKDTATLTLCIGMGTPINGSTEIADLYIDNLCFAKATTTCPTIVATEGGTIEQAVKTPPAAYKVTKHHTYTASDLESPMWPDIAANVGTYTAVDGVSTFESWYKDGEFYSADRTVTIADRGAYEARFRPKASYTVNANVQTTDDNVQGGYLVSDATTTAMEGTVLTLEVVPYSGNIFDGWYNKDTNEKLGSDLLYEHTVTADINVEARFVLNNIWPDAGFENIEINTQMIFDKMETPTMYNGVWYLNRPCHWWNGIVTTDPKDSANKTLRFNTKNNEVMCDATVERNKEYEFSFDWMISNSTISLGYVEIYDSNGMEIAKKTGSVTTTEYQRFTMNFNSGDNEMISVAIYYYAGSASAYFYLDNVCLR